MKESRSVRDRMNIAILVLVSVVSSLRRIVNERKARVGVKWSPGCSGVVGVACCGAVVVKNIQCGVYAVDR